MDAILAACTVLGLILAAVPLLLVGARLRGSQAAVTLSSVPDVTEEEDLQLLFQGRRVPRITRSEVRLWNAGFRALVLSELRHPLTLDYGEAAKVLRARIVARSPNTREIRLTLVGDHAIEVNGDYLNHRDSVLIEVLHTGQNKAPELSADGPNFKSPPIEAPPKHSLSALLVGSLFAMLFGAFGTSAGREALVTDEVESLERVVLGLFALFAGAVVFAFARNVLDFMRRPRDFN